MRISAKTDTGLKRQSNQDCYAYGELPDSVVWAVVCDGMGGAAGGNVASSTAVKIISDRIKSLYRDNMSFNSIKNMLSSAIAAANISVYDQSLADSALFGMGTTVVVTLVSGNVAYFAHAGDSRAYVIHGEKISQITKDHSIVQDMIDKGELSEEEALIDPRKNIITRALGISGDLRVDFCEEYLDKDDVVLLCTDGLTNFIKDDDIRKIYYETEFDSYADKLVETANRNGGGDNITVVAIAEDKE